jgi:hypothetical protein
VGALLFALLEEETETEIKAVLPHIMAVIQSTERKGEGPRGRGLTMVVADPTT